jgi:N-acetylmuramoyl-L-alanine amidase
MALTRVTLPCAAQTPPFTTDVVKTAPRAAAKPVLSQPSPWDALPHGGAEASPWTALAPRISPPAQPGEGVAVRHVLLKGDAQRAEIVLTLAQRTPVSVFALNAPDRVVVDGAGFNFETTSETVPRSRLLLRAPRAGALLPTTGRMIFDADGPVRLVSIVGKPAGDSVDVTIVVERGTRGKAAVPGEPLLWGGSDASPVLVPLPQTATAGLPVVVIDPGHGGIDPGAVTDQGVLEKDVVFAVAMQLRALLVARGRIRPVMTRDSDAAVRLDRRIAVAQDHKARLFVSLHADAYAGQGGASVRGGAVYVLGADASNAAARALAERENTADARAGVAGADGPNLAVDGILADLTMRETSALSQRLQAGLVQSLKRSILLAREPARAAAFRVLKQAETPAVLIELGYMSNGQDVALLQSPEWQLSVASRIADAIEAFLAPAFLAPGFLAPGTNPSHAQQR